MNKPIIRAFFCGISLLMIPALLGQASSSKPVPEERPTGIRRLSIGFRVAGYPFNVLQNKDESFTTTDSTPATFTIKTTNNYLKVGFGPSLEFALSKRFSLSGEVFYHRLNYAQTTQISQGTANTGITENTRATFWDVPLMLRFRGLREEGFLSHVYFAGGAALRDAANINSNTVTNNPDGTTTTNKTAIRPSAKNLAGVVAGTGLRFVDDFGIKVEPELRYTRWLGATFESESTRSRRDQIEVSLAFVF
jgi:hypothetical protein